MESDHSEDLRFEIHFESSIKRKRQKSIVILNLFNLGYSVAPQIVFKIIQHSFCVK